MRSLHLVFHNGCTRVHSYKWYTMFSFYHILNNTCVFLIVVILTVMKRYLTMILICISVMFSNVHNHVLYLLTISIFSLGKCIINVFVHFLVRWTALKYWVTQGALLASWDTLGPFSSTSLQQRECWNKGGHINIFLF